MQGSYFCVAEDGERFEVPIAPFPRTAAAVRAATTAARPASARVLHRLSQPPPLHCGAWNDMMAIWAEWLARRPACPPCNGRCCWRMAARRPPAAALQRPAQGGGLFRGRHAGRPGRFPARPGRCRASALFLLELGVSVVLFETGGRIALRWFRHNPMVLLQSLLEAVLTYAAVYYVLRWFDVRPASPTPSP
jgi:hypothetical protein